jgi:hypothetical protein
VGQAAAWLLRRSAEARALFSLLRRHGAGSAALASAVSPALVAAVCESERLSRLLCTLSLAATTCPPSVAHQALRCEALLPLRVLRVRSLPPQP